METLSDPKHELLLTRTGTNTPESRAVMAILQTAHLINASCAARLTAAGISESRFALLLAVERAPESTPADLATALGITRAAMTPHIERLVTQGLLRRTAHPADRRSARITLTPQGDALLAELVPAYGDWVRELASGLNARQAGELIAALTAVQRHTELCTGAEDKASTDTDTDTDTDTGTGTEVLTAPVEPA